MNRRLGWGVVGCGWVGRDLAAAAITECANAELVALCDDDPVRLAEAGARFPDARSTTDLDAMLADEAVQAVYVATPNHTHAAIVQRIAAAGCDVLCEKPMATSAADARAMLEACADAGVRYATAFDQRHHAAHRRLRLLVADGTLGVVTLARIHYACWLGPEWSPWPGLSTDNWRIDPLRAGGGALVDLAPHGIDLLPFLLDDEWSRLMALEQHRIHAYHVADGASLVGLTAGGVLASIDVSYNCPELLPRRRLEIHGTAGMVEAIDTMGQTAGGRLTFIDAVDGARHPIEVAPEDDRSPFLAQIEAFGRHVLDGETLCVEPATDVRHVELLATARDLGPVAA